MRYPTLTLFLFLCCFLSARTNPDTLVAALDETIKLRATYQGEREARIADLKQHLIHATTDEQRYNLYGSLLEQYRGYDTDSSLVYSERRYRLAERLAEPDKLVDATMNMAELLGMAGMYMEALDLLQGIHSKSLPDYLQRYYYHLYRTIYGLMSDYAVTAKEKQAYATITDHYRDSLLVVHVDDPLNHALVQADQFIVHGRYDEALQVLNNVYQAHNHDTRALAVLAYTLSEAYRHKGDRVHEKEYLLISSINDLRSAVREYVSLRKLATLMYEEGDVEHAYNYLKCSLEDATLCNARLRTLEISQVFPIIDNAYQAKVTNQKRQMTTFLISVSTLSLLLLCAVFYIYKQMKKVAAARRQVIEANKQLSDLNARLNHFNTQLTEANRSLSEAGHIKEAYIGRYMDQCSDYIDKLENYRRSLGKLASVGKVDELYKAIKSNRFIEDELKDFYSRFDDTFLRLFPTFIADFNALLTEPLQPKPGELLSTELRIFALIRLGIADSNKIARFLRYSVTTIYNYRTRVRNKARGEREEFEGKVMKL